MPQAADTTSLSATCAASFILVLAHHSAVAYFWGVPTSRAPLLKTPMLWRAFPAVDPHAHSALMTLFVSFNDTFLMADALRFGIVRMA
jgi:hypothetical protein